MEGRVIKSWRDSGAAYLAVAFPVKEPTEDEPNRMVDTEFIAATPLVDQNGFAKDDERIALDLKAAIRGQYLRQFPPAEAQAAPFAAGEKFV